MVRIPMSEGRTACIDTTEVTREQYAAFLADTNAHGAGSRLPNCGAAPYQDEPEAACSKEPTVCKGDCARHPQVCVTHCNAQAFCSWAGKKLCGTVGDVVPTLPALEDPRVSVWAAACGAGSTDLGRARRGYPYGDEFEPTACNTEGRAGSGCAASPSSCGTVPVGSIERCRGPEPFAVYDMSGNAREWIALSESESTRAKPYAVHMGGSFDRFDFDPPQDFGCSASRKQEAFGVALPTIGFRCCAD
jgi:formylglycine-generating enzyme required for sulfatase activity